MNLSLFAGSAFYKAYSAELIAHGCAFISVSRPFVSAFPDGTWLGVIADREGPLAWILAESAVDAQAWREMLDGFPQKDEAIGGLLSLPIKLNVIACFMLEMLRRNKILGVLELAQFLAQTPRRFLTRSFESPKLQAMLRASGMHLDYAPDIAGGGVFPYLEGMAGQNFSMALGPGGADTIIRAMVSAIRARGGRVECGTNVTKIVHEGGRATGIELADGRRIAARKAVIAGVSPQGLSRLTGPVEPRFDKAMADYAYLFLVALLRERMNPVAATEASLLARCCYPGRSLSRSGLCVRLPIAQGQLPGRLRRKASQARICRHSLPAVSRRRR